MPLKKNWNGTPEERFWRYIKKGGKDECWEWVGSKINGGYGNIRIFNKMIVSHRFSYELHKGKIPEGLLVCHSCDNPPCCNPKHLWLGTAKDNAVDMIKKGRGHNSSKLSEHQVLEIRKLYKEKKELQKNLAKKYLCAVSTVSEIVNKKYWKNI